jgi:hypothetical protein
MLRNKPVFFGGAILLATAILLVINVLPEEKAAEAMPCTMPVPKCCIKKSSSSEENYPHQPVTNFILHI